MELSQRNLMFLAHNQELVGTTIVTEHGEFKVLDYLDYDSMTHTFSFEVQNTDTLEVTCREFSDKSRYDVYLSKRRKYANSTRLTPKRR